MSEKVAAVLGVGPGLGAAISRRFAREGFSIALMARREESLSKTREEIENDGGRAVSIPTDATDPESVERAFGRVRSEIGDPEVFVYNAGAFEMGGILDLSPGKFDECFRANCAGAFYAARQVLPAMVEAGRGTVILTGATAALRGSARFSALAVGKFGLRALSQSMAREFGPQGIHVAHAIIDGQIETEGDNPTESPQQCSHPTPSPKNTGSSTRKTRPHGLWSWTCARRSRVSREYRLY